LVRRTAYLGVSESLSIASTIICCGHNVARSLVSQQGDFAGRLHRYESGSPQTGGVIYPLLP
jgi:hypothetical protein